MKRLSLLITIAAILGFFVAKDFKMQDDPVTSLVNPDPEISNLFEKFHEKSPFHGWLFIDYTKASKEVAGETERMLEAFGYQRSNLIDTEQLLKTDWTDLIGLLPEADFATLTSDREIEARANSIASIISLPGSSGFLQQVATDPLGIGEKMLGMVASRLGSNRPSTEVDIGTYKSPQKIDYDNVGELYQHLLKLKDKVYFAGGDLFAYENYAAVHSDIIFCMLVTLPLNALLFWYFARNLWLVAFLLAGTGFSYLTGLFAVRIFYSEVYALVFAFTSTFIGFNNEYLVHLSGIENFKKKETIKGLGSAIGTTFIGFVIMLLSDSAIIRQTALASLGGMAGFIFFLRVFHKKLAQVKITPIKPIAARMPRLGLFAMWAVGLIAVASISWPKIATKIDSFKYSSNQLEKQLEHFEGLTGKSGGFSDLAALRIGSNAKEDSIESAFAKFESEKLAQSEAGAENTPHPLHLYASKSLQAARIETYSSESKIAAAKLEEKLKAMGIGLSFATFKARTFSVLPANRYLELISAVSPFPWKIDTENGAFLIVNSPQLPQGTSGAPSVTSTAIPLSPRYYFDTILTALSHQMAWIFLIGLGVMFVYLIPLQKNIPAVLYIFAPLLFILIALSAYCRISGATLNIIHFLGLALVISVALDYTSIAHSNKHDDVEIGKIVFTALSTIATFGVFVFAKHPVLRDLGMTVTIGVLISFLYTVFIRVDEPLP